MTIYAVSRKSDGQEVYRYEADAPIEWGGMEFADHDHAEVIEVSEPVAPTPGRVMTKLEFLRRFTGAERIALRTVAKENPVVEDYMALLDAAQEVNTADPDTSGGVMMLEAAGLLGAGRAMEILGGQ